jgi:hypothetical protein
MSKPGLFSPPPLPGSPVAALIAPPPVLDQGPSPRSHAPQARAATDRQQVEPKVRVGVYITRRWHNFLVQESARRTVESLPANDHSALVLEALEAHFGQPSK